MNKKLIVFIMSASFIISSAVCFAEKEKPETENIYEQIELFTDALSAIQTDYVEEVSPKKAIYGALKGMLADLDAHSQFLDPEIYSEIKVETQGKFGGLGIEITIKDDLLTVVAPIADTPADKAGLKSGDRIIKIDGEITKDITLMEAVKKLRGKPGTQVKITVAREGEKEFLDFTITRDIIKVKSIKEAKILEDKIGYIRLVEFQERTANDFDLALADLKAKGMEALILDLRNNPGGLLSSAIGASERFIPKGDVIVSTKGRIKEQNTQYLSKGRKEMVDLPLIVMINGGSASGSEIVAGAIQDYKRGIILGEKSFGKGSVQTIIPLKDGSALRLTTSKYFTPLGRVIHNAGVVPDVVVAEEKSKDKKEDEKSKSEEIFKKIEKEPETPKPVYDNQLARAVDLMKGVMIYKKSGK
ncbi:MAG: S41 family peptidase [Candidatus Omnitrophota bacterium]